MEYFRTRPEIYEGGGWRHLKKDGTRIHVEVVSRAITFSGRPARVALVRDVTDRRQAGQERLARSEREMRALTARLQTIRDEEDARVRPGSPRRDRPGAHRPSASTSHGS